VRAFLYTGGHVFPEHITEHPKAEDVCIAVDGGYHNAKKLGERVDVLVGDLDSIQNVPRDEVKDIRQVPAEKDVTDTQLALEIALEAGADEIIMVGGLGGRLDHTLANLGVLEDMFDRHIHGYAVDGQNRVHFIRSTSTLIARSSYKYISLLPADQEIKGVTIEGGKYPLKNQRLKRNMAGFTVSNEITGNVVFISVKKGGVYIIESRDI